MINCSLDECDPDPDCGGHGACISGICQCCDGYSGISCNSTGKNIITCITLANLSVQYRHPSWVLSSGPTLGCILSSHSIAQLIEVIPFCRQRHWAPLTVTAFFCFSPLQHKLSEKVSPLFSAPATANTVP